MSLITAHGAITYSYQEWEADLYRRLSGKYKARKIKFIIEVEDLWQDGYFDKLYKKLAGVIRGKAKKHVWQWGNTYKIDVEELESLYSERLWRLFEDDYYCTSSKLSFYENFINHIESNVLMNYLKGLKANKRFLAYSQKEVCSFEQAVEDRSRGKASNKDKALEVPDVAEKALAKVSIEEIYDKIGTGYFTEREEAVLQALRLNPGANYSEIARITGLSHAKQVQRVMEYIRRKLLL